MGLNGQNNLARLVWLSGEHFVSETRFREGKDFTDTGTNGTRIQSGIYLAQAFGGDARNEKRTV